MKPDYWQLQKYAQPLFPELEWSRPENKMAAGKLLVVGGNLHGFAAPAEGYGEAVQAGAGAVRALLPQSIQKFVGIIIENADYAASTPASGSFSQKALGELLDAAHWSDGVLLAGDFGRNSETAILIEKFLQKFGGQVTITKDAVDYVASAPQAAFAHGGCLVVGSFSQLQRLAIAAKFSRPLTFSMDLLRLVEWLHDFTTAHSLGIVVKHHNNIAVAMNGQVSTTFLATDVPIWRLKVAARAAVWRMQNPNNQFAAVTTSLVI